MVCSVSTVSAYATEKCGNLLTRYFSSGTNCSADSVSLFGTTFSQPTVSQNIFYHPFVNHSSNFSAQTNLPDISSYIQPLDFNLFSPITNLFSKFLPESQNIFTTKVSTVASGRAQSAQKKAPQVLRSSNRSFTTVKPKSGKTYASVSEAGYNSNLGAKIAADAKSHACRRSQHKCAHYVGNVFDRLGISWTREGSAADLPRQIVKNKNFREVSINSVDLRNLPAGCVIVYPRRAAGYSSEHGHVEISLGNGTAASDFVNSNIKYASNARVFVPVSSSRLA